MDHPPHFAGLLMFIGHLGEHRISSRSKHPDLNTNRHGSSETDQHFVHIRG